ncbi:MAG: ParB/RepB/Spo0J family partition protein [Bacteroidetes bacterium]|nr:ParB/RepB/Spo0J family partition protein [Bacteroidota bacterium]
MVKRSSLGKGLAALLEDSGNELASASRIASGNSAVVGSVANIHLSQIEANPFQPRNEFEKQALAELAQSIKEYGLIQPITVRKIDFNKFQIISGERRFRALQLAGLDQIPAFIRIANDNTMLEMALVENLQREDLNAIEVALGYKRLIEECNLTQEQLSNKVGQDRSTVTNFLRLLKLPEPIQAALRDKKITMGHARALLSVNDAQLQTKILNDILKNELSVRRIEEYARNYSGKKPNQKSKVKSQKKTAGILSFEEQKLKEDLSDFFKTNVSIEKQPAGDGKIVIHFKSDAELKKISRLLDL